MIPWSGKRVVVVGAARQGTAIARYLARQGAEVVVNDRLPAEKLGTAQLALADETIEWVLGGHPLGLLDRADIVCVSGGIPTTNPLLVEARRRRVPLTNDAQIFLEAAPCPVIGITGSAGKTTTTTLVGRMAIASQTIEARNDPDEPQLPHRRMFNPPRKVWVGGNIGNPLISTIDKMQPGDLAVMELSSFQLELMTVSPYSAAVLNITPNHLDRHGTMEAYQAAKARILNFQTSQDVAVLNRDDPGSWRLADRAKGNILSFGINTPLPAGQDGVCFGLDGHSIQFHGSDLVEDEFLLDQADIALRGNHNLANVLGACAIAKAAGLPSEAVIAGVSGFNGVPHRLEFVRHWGGADWYNDSIATAPERAMAAIRSFSEPLIVLVGGRDKDLPWNEFADLAHRRVEHLILFGEAGEKISDAILQSPVRSQIGLVRCTTLLEAVQTAARLVSPGDVVLLAPGGTSFDEFRDFEDRGEAYKKWVMALP
jgi:UDP-N-acetylmuramoylalanine--D-glutamate ligase